MLPTHRPPTHPGEMLLKEFLEARARSAKGRTAAEVCEVVAPFGAQA
jgi:plasmid maintenance system antidote protein VapI